jgi:hypothetical protein
MPNIKILFDTFVNAVQLKNAYIIYSRVFLIKYPVIVFQLNFQSIRKYQTIFIYLMYVYHISQHKYRSTNLIGR